MINHEPVVPNCEGCQRCMREVLGEKRIICARHPDPRMQWLILYCDDATHIGIKKHQDDEDHTHYDSRKKVR